MVKIYVLQHNFSSPQLNQYKLGKLPGDGAESVRVNGEAETKDGGSGVSGVDGSGGSGTTSLNSDTVSIWLDTEGMGPGYCHMPGTPTVLWFFLVGAGLALYHCPVMRMFGCHMCC